MCSRCQVRFLILDAAQGIGCRIETSNTEQRSAGLEILNHYAMKNEMMLRVLKQSFTLLDDFRQTKL